MKLKTTVLIIEDDETIRNMLELTLVENNYRPFLAQNGEEGMMMFKTHNPDIIVLDLGLPDIDGIEVIKSIRKDSQTPIIIISARFEDTDKVAALDEGADDYLTKPFSIVEFLARIRVSERRIIHAVSESNSIDNGLLHIDLSSKIASINEIELNLTPIEYKILIYLAENIDRVVTHNAILKEVWGYYSDSIDALRVFVATLRKKIAELDPENTYIQTHVGIGYRMLKQK